MNKKTKVVKENAKAENSWSIWDKDLNQGKKIVKKCMLSKINQANTKLKIHQSLVVKIL